ncbi:MAG TPA: PAS domain S-box protein [Longimicrobiales bacterium]
MSIRILVIEDSATQAEELRSLLTDAGYETGVATSGEEALRMLETEAPPDLILTDVLMPGIDGYELCRRIKARPELGGIPVVLLTSLADPMDIVKGLECGADNYITKPYEAGPLLARIRHVLDNRALRQGSKTSLGVTIRFLDRTLSITSDREQIVDLLLSSIEDMVRTNKALRRSQDDLADAHAQLEAYARRMEREARLSEEKYRALMHHAHDAILVLDARGRIVEANASASAILGRNDAALTGESLVALAAPEDAAQLQEALDRLAQGRRSRLEDLRFRTGDGDVVWCTVSLSLTPVDEEALGLAVLRDVTERHAAEEALREAIAFLETLFETAPVATFAMDREGRITRWNAAAERIFGWSAEEVLGQPLPFVPPEEAEQSRDLLERIFAGESISLVEAERRRRDGRRIQVAIAAGPLRDADGRVTGGVAMLSDITDRKRLEEQFRHAQKLEAVGRLAGGVAHDFNNILLTVQGYASFLLGEVGDDARLREMVEEIQTAGHRGAALTRQLLAFSRKQVVNPRHLDLNDVIRNLANMLRRLITEEVMLQLALDESIGAVLADPSQIEQVVINLVVNARDAMPGGGEILVETKRVTLGDDYAHSHADLQPGRYVMLAVSDNGIGMSPEVQAQIFEPFFTTKEAGKGTGLGLSTVYGIVTQCGGSIQTYSEPGAGTTFKVFFPEVERNAVGIGSDVAEEDTPRGTETVLLVEDDAVVRKLVREALASLGYSVLEAESGEAALAISAAHSGPIELLITDVVMPGAGGRQLAEQLASTRDELRVLYMSGYTDDAIVHHGVLDEGMSFLQKPFSPEALGRKVRAVLDGSRAGGASTSRGTPNG